MSRLQPPGWRAVWASKGEKDPELVLEVSVDMQQPNSAGVDEVGVVTFEAGRDAQAVLATTDGLGRRQEIPLTWLLELGRLFEEDLMRRRQQDRGDVER